MSSIPATVLRQPDVDAGDVEGNLLVEAVSLLLQRQRETESWLTEQFRQTERSAAQVERRYTELDQRLSRIEQRLAGLVRNVDPSTADDRQLSRLREQVETLSSGVTTLTARPTPIVGLPPRPGWTSPPRGVGPREDVAAVTPAPEPPSATAEPAVVRVEAAPAEAVVRTAPQPRAGGVWYILGDTPADRFGALLIGGGAIAVLYTVLTQLGFS